MMQKRTVLPLSAFRGFDVAARRLSFTKAADELGVTQGAVSRQVRLLEEHLDTPLFRRFTRRIELTDAGEELHSVVSDLFERLSSVTTRIRRRTETDVLTVSVLPTVASAWLMPRLHLFTERFPSIEVRLHTSIDPVIFGMNGPDVAIRVGRIPGWHYERRQPRVDLEMAANWRGIHIDPLFPDRLVPVCRAELLGCRQTLTPEEIAQLPLIHTTSRRFAWPDWLRAHGISPPDEDAPRIELGHFFMSLQAARQGRGVALVPDLVVQNEIDGGNLIVPFRSGIESAGHYCLLVPDGDLEKTKVVDFRRWLETLQRTTAAVELRPTETVRDISKAKSQIRVIAAISDSTIEPAPPAASLHALQA